MPRQGRRERESIVGFAGMRTHCANARQAVDLWDAAQALKKDINRIRPLDAA